MSADQQQVVEYIRYSLSRIRARLEHHAFEDICRYITQARICANVLPATGPVAGSGDQGRDFESFRSFLNEQLTDSASFIGVADKRMIVGACTTQQDGLDAKIASDIDKIMQRGPKPDAIYYFVEPDLKVADIHRLQDECQTTHGVELYVFDGHGIAHLLAQPDLFWIAERFLSVPQNIYPRLPADTESAWYDDLRDAWNSQKGRQLTAGDFIEVKMAARYAANECEKVRQDVPFWLSLLERFRDEEPWRDILRERAIYEIVVVSLKGLRSMSGLEQDLREYFSGVATSTDPIFLSDAQTLLMYCVHARDKHLVDLPEVEEWATALEQRLTKLESSTPSSHVRCFCLEALAFHALNPALNQGGGLDRMFSLLDALLNELAKAPLFPVDALADAITTIAPRIAEHSQYSSFAQKLDDAIEQRVGPQIAASRRRDRAMKMYEVQNYRAALHELHGVKVGWYAAETFRGFVLVLRMIADCYRRLHLHLAAKYYYLAAAYSASKVDSAETLDQGPLALADAAQCDYLLGRWGSFASLTSEAERLHLLVKAGTADPLQANVIQHAVMYQAIVLHFMRSEFPAGVSWLTDTLTRAGVTHIVEELAEDIPVAEEANSTLQAMTQKLYGGTPFSDLGDNLALKWRCLGVEWNVHFSAADVAPAIAERFVAMMQVGQESLAGQELGMLPTVVSITLKVRSDGQPEILREDAADGYSWSVTTTEAGSPVEAGVASIEEECLHVLLTVVLTVSLLPEDQVIAAFERAFEGGLAAKWLIADRYEVLLEYFQPSDLPAVSSLSGPPYSTTPVDWTESGLLGWQAGPGPTYSQNRAIQLLTSRYEQLSSLLRITLAGYGASPQLRHAVEQLKAQGWRDWHILSAIYSLVLQYRSEKTAREAGRSVDDAVSGYLGKAEQAEWPQVPLETLSLDRLEMTRVPLMLSSLSHWDLRFPDQLGDANALDQFLTTRYNYWTDDVAHEDPFGS